MPKIVFHDSQGIDRTVDLGADPLLIGRATECAIQTQDAMVSRRHARILWDGGYWIEDLGSANGVYVGSERVPRAPLRPGDEVRCGSLTLRLQIDLPAAPPAYAPPPASAPAGRRMTGALGAVAPSAPPLRTTAPPPAPEAPPAPVDMSNTPEVRAERARRVQAEEAHTAAERRATYAEGRLYEFEQQLTELQSRLNAAEAKAQAAGERAITLETSAREGERWHRQVDQLKADIRRLRGGQPVEDPASGEGAKWAELEARAERAERERDEAVQRAQAAAAERDGAKRAAASVPSTPPRATAAGSAVDPVATTATTTMSDALDDLRSSLRAASDEIGVLGVEAPGDSVTVLKDALTAANEQLESARSQVRELKRIFKIS